MALMQQHVVNKIRVNSPIELGQGADVTVTYTNGRMDRLRTSPVEDYFYSKTGQLQIQTKNSLYMGQLENPEILDIAQSQKQLDVAQPQKQEHSFYKIRLNEPPVLGERADVIATKFDGSWMHMKTSAICGYHYDTDGNIQIQTKNSVYKGSLENPEILMASREQSGKTVEADIQEFASAVSGMQQQNEILEQ